MVEKAKIIVLDTKEEIPVMFNPSDYTETKEAGLSGEGPGMQFNGVKVSDFSVTLFYDTYEEKTESARDVRKKIDKLADLVLPKTEGKQTKFPPTCLFSWGGFTYKGIIYKISKKFTMFLSTGIPVRAEITLTFKAMFTEKEYALLQGKEACRKLWTVKSGDRLDLIAHHTLKNPTEWRKIALANNITNPLHFPCKEDIGRVLVIPDLV